MCSTVLPILTVVEASRPPVAKMLRTSQTVLAAIPPRDAKKPWTARSSLEPIFRKCLHIGLREFEFEINFKRARMHAKKPNAATTNRTKSRFFVRHSHSVHSTQDAPRSLQLTNFRLMHQEVSQHHTHTKRERERVASSSVVVLLSLQPDTTQSLLLLHQVLLFIRACNLIPNTHFITTITTNILVLPSHYSYFIECCCSFELATRYIIPTSLRPF